MQNEKCYFKNAFVSVAVVITKSYKLVTKWKIINTIYNIRQMLNVLFMNLFKNNSLHVIHKFCQNFERIMNKVIFQLNTIIIFVKVGAEIEDSECKL